MNLAELETKTKDELVDVAKDLGVEKPTGLRKQDLVFRIMQAKAEREGNYFAGGILEMANDGYGFLRTQDLKPSLSDVYVSQTQVRRFALRTGDYVMGAVRQPKESEKYYGLLRVDAVNGLDPDTAKKRPYFEQLTPIFPDEKVNLEEGVNNLSTRVIDLVAPVGRGVADYLQLEIEDLQEAWSHPLFDREPPPATLEEFVDPRLPKDELKPLGLPRYAFRRLTHMGDALARMRTQALEPQAIHRFVADWEAGSAGHATDLANHWVIALREHMDRYRQTLTRAAPVSALNGDPPRFAAREGTRGLALHEALAAFDRHLGYPFAWFFHMLTTKAVPHWVARTVAEDAAGGYAYLPERDLAVVREWLHKPYGF